MKPNSVWVLVADGAHARIVRDSRTITEAATRLEDLVFAIDHKQSREIKSDRPGRSFASRGPRRSAMGYRSDPVERQEAEFAGQLVDELERRFAAREFQRLAVVAEPRMLGRIRQRLSPALRHAALVQIPQDLTKLPALELRKVIAELGISRRTDH